MRALGVESGGWRGESDFLLILIDSEISIFLDADCADDAD